ncbi:hypothetical protein [Ramlibacter sp. AN1133]|uniref:hypothetical protein n=1 Tax=Ramlibacter sp. AN1133 TaxID=3133429 RepID=UPI0030BC6726
MMKGLRPGVAPEDAAPLLAASFHIDEGQVRMLLAQLPAQVKSAVAYERAVEYQRSICQAGGDCVVEAEAPPHLHLPEAASVLQTTSGHSVIEDGIAISQFDYEPHSDAPSGGLRSLKSWWASHVRLVHVR